jgi:hypothetical protein
MLRVVVDVDDGDGWWDGEHDVSGFDNVDVVGLNCELIVGVKACVVAWRKKDAVRKVAIMDFMLV